MIKNLLLLLSILLTITSYTRIIQMYLTNKNKVVKNLTGFDLAKEITMNYDEMNIIESKDIYLSKYNLKRRVIKLTTKNYEENNLFTLSLVACLSGYSLTNMVKDKYLNLYEKIFSNIDCLSKSSILTIGISLFTNTKTDAKIGLVILILFLIYQYQIVQINTISTTNLSTHLKKIIPKKELSIINQNLNILLSAHTITFITTLILIIRELLIIL